MRNERNEQKLLNDYFITTSDVLLNEVHLYMEKVDRQSENDLVHSAAFYKRYIRYLQRFYDEVASRDLIENAEKHWCYAVDITDNKIDLKICKVDIIGVSEETNEPEIVVCESFTLIDSKVKMLSVEDYAEQYQVGPGTVRQWIRRGKLRSAKKFGREWRIPELAECTGRGYSEGVFSWDDSLADLPEEFSFLREFSRVWITQNDDDVTLFDLFLEKIDNSSIVLQKRMSIGRDLKEQMELYLIGNLQVKPQQETLGQIFYRTRDERE